MLLLASCDGNVVICGTTDDNYEPNDYMASAYDLSSDERTWLSNIDGMGVQSDEDWYQIYVNSGSERVIVDLQFTHADGDIDLRLYNASGIRLATSDSLTDDEHVDYTVSASGTYYIMVNYGNACNIYDLWWDDISP
jgi:hypothetical protein